MIHKARLGNEKQVREAFEGFRRARSAKLVRYFAADLTALQAADAERSKPQHRESVLPWPCGNAFCLTAKRRRPLFGVVEVDESLFGARRVEGPARARRLRQDRRLRHLRASTAKSTRRLSRTAQGRPCRASSAAEWTPSTVINSDGWRGYNGLVDLGYGHFRVDHGPTTSLR